jgi:hypothetical protein
MTRLTREAILKADDLPTEVVTVSEWGGEVLVRGLNGTQRDEFEASTITMRGPMGKQQAVPDTANIRAKLVARCIIDEDGEPMFTQSDVHALGQKSSAALDRIFEVASRLSGISKDDLEELGKDSPNGLNGGSTSSSPGNLGVLAPNSSSGSVATN